jgi:hypothetical protein
MNSEDIHADNIISRLFSYSPRPDRDPLEDYCTEALAWCLRNSETFRRKFLAIEGLECIGDSQRTLDVHTQMRFHPIAEDEDEDEEMNICKSGGCFDLVIHPKTGDDFVAVFEAKVGAPLRPDQMEIYRTHLDEGTRFSKISKVRRFLFTLTNSYHKHALAKANVRWSAVQMALMVSVATEVGLDPKSLSAQQVCEQFAEFLKEKGMEQISLQNTTKEPLSILMKGIEFRYQLEQILKAVREQDATLRKHLQSRVQYCRKGGEQFLRMNNKNDQPYLCLGFGLTPDYNMFVEAGWPKDRAVLRRRLLKDGVKLDYEWDTGFGTSQPMTHDFDGNPDKIQEWLTKTALCVRA